MQALSSYSESKHADVARALASLRSPAEGLSAEVFVTAKGFFARFIWPDLPTETSARLGGLIAALHAKHPEHGLKRLERDTPEWSSVFHGWSADLESAGAIERAFSAHFPNRVSWVESERDRGGRIAAKLRVKGLGEAAPPVPETPPALQAAWRCSSGEVSLNLFWKDSMAIPPGPLSPSDLVAFQASVREISQWAERRIRPVLDTLHERLKALYGERFRGLYVFGSYARPDAGIELPESSDLDVALILSEFENLYEERARFGDLVADLSLEHSLVISVVPVSEADFRQGRTNFGRVISGYAVPVK
jgi:predicted nucleotidyltransferase